MMQNTNIFNSIYSNFLVFKFCVLLCFASISLVSVENNMKHFTRNTKVDMSNNIELY